MIPQSEGGLNSVYSEVMSFCISFSVWKDVYLSLVSWVAVCIVLCSNLETRVMELELEKAVC